MQKIAAALLAIAITPMIVQAQSLRTLTSMPLSKFQDSLGINLHIEYTDGEYANESQVLTDLNYIGIHNVRDYIPDPVKWGQGAAQHLEALAAAGIRFDFIGDCNASFSTAMQQLTALVAEYPGIAKSVEGPNEINNFACYTGSGSNLQQATAYQQELYSYVHGESSLKGVPVLYMTGAPAINLLTSKGLADDTNDHPYPYAEEEPYNRIRQEYTSDYTTAESSIARQITETGYFTIPTCISTRRSRAISTPTSTNYSTRITTLRATTITACSTTTVRQRRRPPCCITCTRLCRRIRPRHRRPSRRG
jgi:hypothetical protein